MTKILLVDDSKTMRRIQKTTLHKIGFTEIDEAEDGEDAFNKVSSNKYDIVLLDWNMPIMDGITCLRKIKSTPETKDVPVIMVTSESEKSRIVEAIQSGAANYVVKPFKPETLAEKIQTALG